MGPDQQNDEISSTTSLLTPESSQACTETLAHGSSDHGASDHGALAHGATARNSSVHTSSVHALNQTSDQPLALGALAHGLSSANESALFNVPQYIMRSARNGLYTPEDSPAPQNHCSPAQNRTPASHTPLSQDISRKLRSSIIKDLEGVEKNGAQRGKCWH